MEKIMHYTPDWQFLPSLSTAWKSTILKVTGIVYVYKVPSVSAYYIYFDRKRKHSPQNA